VIGAFVASSLVETIPARRLELFNEANFLDKIATRKVAHPCNDDSSSSTSAPAPTMPQKYRISNDTSKKRRAPTSSSDTASLRHAVLQEARSPAKCVSRVPTPADRESMVWDIEKGLDLPDSSAVDAPVQRETRVSTVLMDTRDAKWSTRPPLEEAYAPIAPISGPLQDLKCDSTEGRSPGIPSGHRRSPSTLAPWHSASQCGISLPVPPRSFLRQSSHHSFAEHSVPINCLPPMMDHDHDDTRDDLYEVENVDFPMPSHQMSATLATPTSPARPVSPTGTVGSFQAALQHYEAEDRSALHASPDYSLVVPPMLR
jgi:hypothetical protein